MRILEEIFQLLFPAKCVLCGKLLCKDETDLCHNCRVDAPECPVSGQKLSFLSGWVALWHYEENVRSSIIRFKFYGQRGYADCYGRLLAMKLQREYPDGFDLLTWVPVSLFRKLVRGYDQSQLLAQAVGEQLGMEPVPLVRKIRSNKQQSKIHGHAQRRANVLGVYRVIDADAVKDKRILLLDDVITTGATAGEVSRILLTAGGKEVYCGAVASARHRPK